MPMTPLGYQEQRPFTVNGEVPVHTQQRGHISTEHTVWCGLCETWDQRSEPKPTGLWRALGWRNTAAHGWVCPKCLEE